jgi:hypothetical protein
VGIGSIIPVMQVPADTFFRSNGNPTKFRTWAMARPASNRTWSHANKMQAIVYPFACDRLRLRLCAFFFLSLLVILFADCLLPDCKEPVAGPLILISLSAFSCCASAMW